MPVSKKVSEEMKKGSWIRKMFEEGIKLKKEFGAENVFDLSLGNPEMEPPEKFQNALKDIVEHPVKGMHRYMPNSGYHETRAAIARMISHDSKTPLSEGDVLMTVGAAGALNILLKAMFDLGDEVIILAPYFVEYLYYLDNHGLKCKIVDTDSDFMPDLAALEKAIGPNTKALLINSPNNPTGAVYENKHIAELAQLLAKKSKEFGNDIALILDDAYGKIVYDGAHTGCVFDHYPHSVVCASFSKTLSIPGERIGYVVVSPKCSNHIEVMGALAFSNRILGFVNAPALMQHLVTKACEHVIDVNLYKRKRDLLLNGLREAGYDVHTPKGAFYLFPRTPMADDVKFTQELLKEKVLAVPGSGFGRSGYMRLAYCVEDRVIEGAIEGFRKAIKRI